MKRFSVRTVTGVGALVFASGSIMCAFATSSNYMFLSYGLLSGQLSELVLFMNNLIPLVIKLTTTFLAFRIMESPQ